MSISIRYDGTDITALCSIAETEFTSRAGGTPGQCTVVFRDVAQRWRFVQGKTIELFIDGTRQWDGYLLTTRYNYWFATHTANCEPCPHVTPRKLILEGVDRNWLFNSRVLYNKASPVDPTEGIWPAGTSDQEVIISQITDLLDDVDGVDYTTKVEVVGSPDPYVEFRVPGPTNTLGAMMLQIAQSTGAVFYIDPDRYLVYTDVNTPDAPYGLSDQPGAGQIGYRDLELLSDGGSLINDAMIWGAGQGKDSITFGRVQDSASIAAHGRWQNPGGFRVNLFNQSSVDRIANSIVYGSPSSKRGHKDDRVSARCTVFTPGFRAAQKVAFESNVHAYSDVIPIREIRITFINVNDARFELTLSHELDEPWTISEYWWPPPPKRTQTPEPPWSTCNTVIYRPDFLGATLPAGDFTAGYEEEGLKGGHKRTRGEIHTYRYLAPGVVVLYTGDNSYDACETASFVAGDYGANLRYSTAYTRATASFDDAGVETFTSAHLTSWGGNLSVWESKFGFLRAPTSSNVTGAGVYARIIGTVYFYGIEAKRDIGINGLPGIGSSRNDPRPLSNPHLVQVTLVTPTPYCHVPNLKGTVIWEGLLPSGATPNGLDPTGGTPLDVTAHFDKGQYFEFSVVIRKLEVNDSHPVMLNVTADFRLGGITYYPVKSEAYAINPCTPMPLSGPFCAVATLIQGSRYQTSAPYVPGSLRVYVNGIHQYGSKVVELTPAEGTFELTYTTSDEVYTCWQNTGNLSLALPDLGSNLFILPTTGTISATFGAQTSLWPSIYWHGAYYEHFHNGVDFGVGSGTPVYAAADGVVQWEDQAAGGTMIHIFHPFDGLRTTYAHLSSRVANIGQSVTQGQLIAYSGASGDVTGAHLHWGLVYANSPEDPLPYTGGV